LAAVTALDRVNAPALHGGGCVATDPEAIEGRGARRRPRARRPQLAGLGLDVGLVLAGLGH
ncbi:hypothetical protein, partial [Polyangium jinanense]